jgi:hypothetical protein
MRASRRMAGGYEAGVERRRASTEPLQLSQSCYHAYEPTAQAEAALAQHADDPPTNRATGPTSTESFTPGMSRV